ncbi:unnamed protein product, partial [Effrenium voratum]
ATLSATLAVVEAQRQQLASAQEELAGVRLQLEAETRAREAAEERLREASVDFARKLAAMQARVLEAERDVVLGSQVLVARSAPSSGGTMAISSPEGLSRASDTPRRLAPVPPPPRADEAAFSRCRVRAGPGVDASPSRMAVQACQVVEQV